MLVSLGAPTSLAVVDGPMFCSNRSCLNSPTDMFSTSVKGESQQVHQSEAGDACELKDAAQTLLALSCSTEPASTEQLQALLACPDTPGMINTADPATGRTALHNVMLSSNEAMMQLLASQPGIDFNVLDHTGRTPLACAVASGCDRIVTRYLLAASANESPAHGMPLDPSLCGPDAVHSSPMALALCAPQTDVLKALLHTVKLLDRLSGTPPGGKRHRRAHSSPDMNSESPMPPPPLAPTLTCGLSSLLKQAVDAQGRPPLMVALLQRKLAHAWVLVGYGAKLTAAEPNPDGTRFSGRRTSSNHSSMSSSSTSSSSSSISSACSSPKPALPGSTPKPALPGSTPMHLLIQYILELGAVTDMSVMPMSGSPVSAPRSGAANAFDPRRGVSSSAELQGSDMSLPLRKGESSPGHVKSRATTGSPTFHTDHHRSISSPGMQQWRSSGSQTGTPAAIHAYNLVRHMVEQPTMQQALLMQDAAGNTCLHTAAQAGLYDVVQYLIKRAASPQTLVYAKNREQMTVIDMARSGGHDEVVRLLINTASQSTRKSGYSSGMRPLGSASVSVPVLVVPEETGADEVAPRGTSTYNRTKLPALGVEEQEIVPSDEPSPSSTAAAAKQPLPAGKTVSSNPAKKMSEQKSERSGASSSSASLSKALKPMLKAFKSMFSDAKPDKHH